LKFKPVPVGPKDRLLLLPVSPNPVQDRFIASYYLPEAGPTTITLTDARGMVVQTVVGYREAGYHTTALELSSSARPGMLFLRLEGPGGVAVQRVLKQ
jgi:hypothetical protein